MPDKATTGWKPWSSGVVIPLAIIALVLGGAALRDAQTVIIPLVFAWMLAQLLAPMVDFFAERRVPTGLAVGFALVVLLFIVYWVTVFISISTASFLQKVPEFRTQIVAIAVDSIEKFNSRFGSVRDEAFDAEVRNQVRVILGGLVGLVGSMVGALTGLLAKVVMIFIIMSFMLVTKPYGEAKIQQAFAPDTAKRVSEILRTISGQISGYLRVQFMISLMTGVLVWLTCHLIGVPSAPTWGALAFFLNFVPTVGSILAAIPPVLLALVQFYPSMWQAFVTLLCVLVINMVLGNVLSPKIMGDKLNLSPVTILLSLLFWGWLWGIAGAFLSVVIACTIKIICANIEPLQPFAVLMESGKSIQRKQARSGTG